MVNYLDRLLVDFPIPSILGNPPTNENPCIITIVITKATLARLQLIAGERGETEDFVWQLASDIVDEAALDGFRGRDDDPGRWL